jgi:hypothetical protein
LFEAEDWVAVFLKAYDTGRVCQRVGPVAMFAEPRWLAWLRVMNAHRFNVYVSVNAMTPGRHERTKDAVRAVRHVVLDADHDGPAVLRSIEARHDLPRPSLVVHSSPGRIHVLWRVRGFSPERVEWLQKHLARELGTDPAATACSQTTRIPGFLNWKYAPPVVVTVEYTEASAAFEPSDFPSPADTYAAVLGQSTSPRPSPAPGHIGPVAGQALQGTRSDVLDRGRRAGPAAEHTGQVAGQAGLVAEETVPVAEKAGRVIGRALPVAQPDVLERARRYVAAVPPAIAGQRGDVRTFHVCCRLARGFGLSTGDALSVLAEWNARCDPPWSERDLLAKLDHAHRYGRESIGGLLRGAA